MVFRAGLVQDRMRQQQHNVYANRADTGGLLALAQLSIMLVVLAGLSLLPQVSHAQPAVRTVVQVDLQRYQGSWYEIARFPHYFQRKCIGDVTAHYQLSARGGMQVRNRCRKVDGSFLQADGQAIVVNPPANSQLAVSFLPELLRWVPFTRGDYWILKLDPQYRHVLVGSPDRNYLWVLSRQPGMDSATFAEYVRAAHDQGFDTKRLLRTRHMGEETPVL